jgi:UDP:flavonoid glycosyltransferase YjiC (YdhE family)
VAEIIVLPLWETGHVVPHAGLAKQLRSRGHDVRFAGWGPMRGIVEAVGERYDPVFDELAPATDGDDWRPQMIEAFSTGRVAERLAARSPDLVLADTSMPEMCLELRRSGLRHARVSITLPHTRRRGVPPLTSSTRPPTGRASAAKVELEWAQLIARKRGVLTARDVLGRVVGRKRFPEWSFVGDQIRRTATPRNVLDWSAVLADVSVRDTPELVLCPPQLDLRPSRVVRYTEPCIDWDRAAEPIDERLDDGTGRPLVMCALGSQSSRYPAVVETLQVVRDLLSRRPRLRAVIACGSDEVARQLDPLPENVATADRIPQLALLQRATLFVTHGGLGSLKEAIASGVPVIVVPQGYDQFGNAVRVSHHGLGVGLRPTDGPSSLSAAIDALVEVDHPSRRGVQCMAEEWAGMASTVPGATVVEGLLR